MIVNINEAKTQLSRLLEAVQQGQRVIIAKAGVPIAEVVPFVRPGLQLGGFEGEIQMADDFDSAETNRQVGRLFAGD